MGGGGARAQINMTPMIDILLVLIIMFLIITPVTSRGLQTLVPQESRDNTAKPPGEPIVIQAMLDGTFQLNTQPIEPEDLERRIGELLLKRVAAARVVFVKGDRDIQFQRVAQAIDAANNAGALRVALMPN
jgi:biopolymer transport protein ExbD